MKEKIVNKRDLGTLNKINPNTAKKIGENQYMVHIPTLPNTEAKKRRGNIAKEVNNITKENPLYKGGHIVKAEWGGDDNMFNVVSWIDKAEKDWTEQFENEITKSFLSNNNDRLQIDINVLKEDELIDSNKFKSLVHNIVSDSQEKDSQKKENMVNQIILTNENIRWYINKAGETIPKSVIGNTMPQITKTISINSQDSGFDQFVQKSEQYITSEVNNNKKKNIPVSFDDIQKSQKSKRSNERKIALSEEYKTLKNINSDSYFFQNIEPELKSIDT